MDKQPTQEQIKEFWEWCGFKLKEVQFGMSGIVPQWILRDYADWELPPLDLNNLFKYAVPKLWDYVLTKTPTGHAIAVLTKGSNPSIVYNEYPALALFWAIWEVIHGQAVCTKL